jgi:hypothetical protein
MSVRAQQVAPENETQIKINRVEPMKNKTIIRSIVAAVLLSGSAAIVTAQAAAPSCPFGHEPGYGRMLTPEQREAHRVVAQQLMAELRQKQADGSLTAQEQEWLARAEQRGGMCLTGTPRGPGHGKGQGLGQGKGQGNGKGRCQGAGQGKRQGLRDGTGPRSTDGTCPNGNAPRRGREQ